MIIDAHCHLWQRDMLPEKYWEMYAGVLSKIAPGNPSIEQVFASEMMQKFIDGSRERLLKEMEAAGIDKSVVFGIDWGLLMGEPKTSIQDYNKYIADSAKEYPDKLIPFFTIDPRRPNAPKLFEAALTKGEMRGLKLHPTSGYLPDSQECYKLYKIADMYKVPVITHIGYVMGLKGRTAQLEYFDSPIIDFPNVRFSFAHFNFGSIDELVSMMFGKPNAYTDISAHGQFLMSYNPQDLYRQLRFVLNYEGVTRRIMFGSDWPAISGIMSQVKWVEAIKNLMEDKVSTVMEKFGYQKFRSKEINGILGENAIGFLNLRK